MNDLEELKESLKEMKLDLKEVLVQTIKTNGRVSNLEEWRERVEEKVEVLNNVRHYNKGFGKVGMIILGAIIALFFQYISSLILK